MWSDLRISKLANPTNGAGMVTRKSQGQAQRIVDRD